ncbi:MAG: hypothetical protein JWR51_249 [Devosia sp.]|uniref:DUF1349 domain-containing protein n=1 Tax=Devosia sp. TaxID=1871048 RepID=UPI002619E14F|nr:DUF1349 domain-containing protein [Devosia sp.]MDB5527146.1 hypothetical protein [Devosia sp.]
MTITGFEKQSLAFGSITALAAEATIAANADTDWFYEPYGKSRRQNVPRLARQIDAPVFSLQAKVAPIFASSYDAGALFVETSAAAWGKLAFEYSPQQLPTIVSVITNSTSDDSDGPRLDAEFAYLRLYAENGVFAFHFSSDGKYWRFLRWFALPLGSGPLTIGMSSQSPTGNGCLARFSEVELRFDKIENLRDGR